MCWTWLTICTVNVFFYEKALLILDGIMKLSLCRAVFWLTGRVTDASFFVNTCDISYLSN
jgi:hypothetical protein